MDIPDINHYDGQGEEELLTTAQMASELKCSLRTVHEGTRKRTIPHVRPPHGRRCYSRRQWLAEWLAGAPLETIELAHGGRAVLPKQPKRKGGR